MIILLQSVMYEKLVIPNSARRTRTSQIREVVECQHLALQTPQLDQHDLPRQREAGDANQSGHADHIVVRGGRRRRRYSSIVDYLLAATVHESRLERVAIAREVHVRPACQYERIGLVRREGRERVRSGGRQVTVHEGTMEGVDARRRSDDDRIGIVDDRRAVPTRLRLRRRRKEPAQVGDVQSVATQHPNAVPALLAPVAAAAAAAEDAFVRIRTPTEEVVVPRTSWQQARMQRLLGPIGIRRIVPSRDVIHGYART